MSAPAPTVHGPTASRVPGRHRTTLGAHTIPTATTRFSDDDMLLLLLVSTWELRTARPAPAGPPAEMTPEELIEYWSDPSEDPCPPDCPAPHPTPGSAAGIRPSKG